MLNYFITTLCDYVTNVTEKYIFNYLNHSSVIFATAGSTSKIQTIRLYTFFLFSNSYKRGNKCGRSRYVATVVDLTS